MRGHPGLLERALHRIEDHIEAWRREEAARKREVEANREGLWAEAAERERLLRRELEQEEHPSGEKGTTVFVLHTGEAERELDLAIERQARLVRRVPGRGGLGGKDALRGSWLVFESEPERAP